MLFGRSRFDETSKKSIREFVTNDDGYYTSAKSPIGMFEELYIPNDLGYIIEKGEAYNNAV